MISLTDSSAPHPKTMCLRTGEHPVYLVEGYGVECNLTPEQLVMPKKASTYYLEYHEGFMFM